MSSNTIKICLFDDHSFDNFLPINDISSRESRFLFQMCSLGDKPLGASLIFIADSFSMTNLPYFFPRDRRVCWLKESPVYSRMLDFGRIEKDFDVVLTHREDLILKGSPYIRVDFSSNFISYNKDIDLDLKKNKLVSFIGSIEHSNDAIYGFRKQVAQFLLTHHGVDCYGRGLNPIGNKLDALENYCFSIAMENVKENFYFSEKLIDCLLSETVPIYYGCPKIYELFDPRGFLGFDTLQELIDILENIDYKKYSEMLPFVKENKKRCIELGLSSYDDYLIRCAEASVSSGVLNVKPLTAYDLSRPMAGLRYFFSFLNV
jgi:hypothetical protein